MADGGSASPSRLQDAKFEEQAADALSQAFGPPARRVAARLAACLAMRIALINTCSLSLAWPHATVFHELQMPTEDRDSLRMAIESLNGHMLIARMVLRPSEVRSMTLTQALA